MKKQTINPWTWQDEYGFVQANAVSGAQRTLVCSGQTSVDADGKPLHPGDMRGQIAQATWHIEHPFRQALQQGRGR